jgi:hypothetical protein
MRPSCRWNGCQQHFAANCLLAVAEGNPSKWIGWKRPSFQVEYPPTPRRRCQSAFPSPFAVMVVLGMMLDVTLLMNFNRLIPAF